MEILRKSIPIQTVRMDSVFDPKSDPSTVSLTKRHDDWYSGALFFQSMLGKQVMASLLPEELITTSKCR